MEILSENVHLYPKKISGGVSSKKKKRVFRYFCAVKLSKLQINMEEAILIVQKNACIHIGALKLGLSEKAKKNAFLSFLSYSIFLAYPSSR